jgi:signal transduction histidine kinase
MYIMPQILKKIRIKQKLIIINLLTTGATLLVVGTVLLINEFISTRNALIYSLTSQAEIVANNSTAPIVFNDRKSAEETLRALSTSPNITLAILYDKQGKVFADYRRANATSEPPPSASLDNGYSFTDDQLNIFRNILLDGEMIGSIHIRSDLEKLRSIMMRDGVIAAVTMLTVFVMAFFLLMQLQKVITEPLSELTNTMRTISRNGDYSQKANVSGEDEIASLAKRFNEMLEQIRQRDMQLNVEIHERKRAQEELVRSEKLSMLGLIAGGMGNELRNPLGVMNNAVFYLKSIMPDADENVREYLNIIKQEIDNSLQIISDLHDFSRLKPPAISSISAPELVKQCLEKCSIPENVTVKLDLPATLPSVMADSLQMGKILQNIITNAVQAMPDGGALRIAARQPDADYMEISIADTGEGISAENLSKLFEPLFTTRSRGIGLGLALSKKYAEANGSRIEVESELGKGATFSILLPVEESDERNL